MAGIVTEIPFPTYPDGFPQDVVDAFTAIAGKAPLGNIPASGTEIIADLGEEHQKTGRPILYTSSRFGLSKSPPMKRRFRSRRSTIGASARGLCSCRRIKSIA